MSYFRPAGIDETPCIDICNWSVYRVTSELWDGETDHLCGYNLTEMHGRVSSAIVEYNKEEKTVRTESGRMYKLVDSIAKDPDGQYVWNIWASRNRLTSVVEVSKEYFSI